MNKIPFYLSGYDEDATFMSSYS